MSNRVTRQVRSYVATLILLALFSVPVLWTGAHSMPASSAKNNNQEESGDQQRLLKWHDYSNPVVRLTDVKTNGKQIQYNQRFIEGDDWWKDLTLTVENISDKPVTYIEANIKFFGKDDPDSNGQLPLNHFIGVGTPQDPETDTYDPPSESTIAPGRRADIVLREDEYNNLKFILAKSNYQAKVKVVQVSVIKVIFGDGKMWYHGFMFMRDPNNPSKWIRDRAEPKKPDGN